MATCAIPMLVAASALTVGHSPAEQLRLTPDEVLALPSQDGGAGTSGVDGIRTRVLAGDPTRAGPYTIALEVPANTTIAAHTHRDDRVATVISGTWYFGYGVAAGAGFKALEPGSFYTEPGGMGHFARTGAQPVTLYIHGLGPTDTRYLETSAAPRR